MADKQVNVTGKSDQYDRVLGKIIDYNARLAKEVKQAKTELESLNPVYDKLAESAEKYADALKEIRPLRGNRGNSEKAEVDQQVNQTSRLSRIQQQQANVERITIREKQQNLRLLYANMSNLSSYARGRGNYGKTMSTSMRTASTGARALSLGVSGASTGMLRLVSSGGRAVSVLGRLGSAAGPVGMVVAGVGIALAITAGLLAKIGEEGYKTQLKIANTQNVLGDSFKETLGYAKKLNSELGVSVSRTMEMVSATAQMGRGAGFSTSSATNLGLGVNGLATDISFATGASIESIQEAMNQAISSGANTLGQYGINMDDNAVKAWLLQTQGIDAFNGAISEAAMQYARYNLIMEQANLLQYENAGSANNLTASYERLKNNWDSITRNLSAVFIPIFDWVVGVLEKATGMLLKFVNGVRALSGLEQIKFADSVGPSESSIKAVQDLYSGYKKTGDELDKMKQQLYSFDEVITQNPYDPRIPEIGTPSKGVDEAVKLPDGKKEKDKWDWLFAIPKLEFKNPFSNWKFPKWSTLVDKAQAAWDAIRLPSWVTETVGVVVDFLEPRLAPAWDWLKKVLLVTTPVGVAVTLLSPVLAPAWDWIQDMLKGKSFATVGVELKSWVTGNASDLLKRLLSLGLHPVTVPMALAVNVLGLAQIDVVREANKLWSIATRFIGVEALQGYFQSAVSFLETSLASIAVSAEQIGQTISSWFEGVDIKGFLDTTMQILDILSLVAMIIPGLGLVGAGMKASTTAYKAYRVGKAVDTGVDVARGASKGKTLWDNTKAAFSFGGGAVPAYATGGFHVKPHLGLVGDVPEVTLPLNSSSATPAYSGIADNILSQMGNSGNGAMGGQTIVHLGENSTIIADDYGFQRLASKLSEYLDNRDRSVGDSRYGLR